MDISVKTVLHALTLQFKGVGTLRNVLVEAMPLHILPETRSKDLLEQSVVFRHTPLANLEMEQVYVLGCSTLPCYVSVYFVLAFVRFRFLRQSAN